MRRLATISIVLVGLAVVVLAVAQLVLPGIAAQRVRDQLRGDGAVRSVSVQAFPAIELLWHHADRVTVHLADYRAGSGRLGGSLGQTADVGTLTASADTAHVGLLTVHDATLTKRGDRLLGTGTVTEADLRAAVPILRSITPVASAGGRLTLRGTASLLGLDATVDANVAARDGALVVSPAVPLGALATITVFSDPRVHVEGVSAAARPGGFTVRATAELR